MTAPVCRISGVGPGTVRLSPGDLPRAAIASPFLPGARRVLPHSRRNCRTPGDIDVTYQTLRKLKLRRPP